LKLSIIWHDFEKKILSGKASATPDVSRHEARLKIWGWGDKSKFWRSKTFLYTPIIMKE